MKKEIVENHVRTNKQPDFTQLNFNNSMRTNRMPLKGYRKELDCQVGVKKCYNAERTRILKDPYATCTINCVGRTPKPLIKSGMQHKLDANNKKVEYSYSYREYLHNKKNMTYDRKLKKKFISGSIWQNNGGNCSSKNCTNQTISKLNNNGFQTQGAVDSSLRLTNLKMKTIHSESKCSLEGFKTKCNGVYFAGKPRFTGFLFNNRHLEINCPQKNARDKVLGNTRNKKC
jgi:hypothetical protein